MRYRAKREVFPVHVDCCTAKCTKGERRSSARSKHVCAPRTLFVSPEARQTCSGLLEVQEVLEEEEELAAMTWPLLALQESAQDRERTITWMAARQWDGGTRMQI